MSRVFGAFAEMTKNGGNWAQALEAVMPKKKINPDEKEKEELKPSGNAGLGKKKKRTKRGGKKHRKENKVAT